MWHTRCALVTGVQTCALPILRVPAAAQQALALQAAANGDVLELPVLGQVAAGAPIGADIGSDQMVLMDRAFFSPAPDYLLKVKGESMRDEGIFDGDLIGVHRTADARSGQLVLARIAEETEERRGGEACDRSCRSRGMS